MKITGTGHLLLVTCIGGKISFHFFPFSFFRRGQDGEGGSVQATWCLLYFLEGRNIAVITLLHAHTL